MKTCKIMGMLLKQKGKKRPKNRPCFKTLEGINLKGTRLSGSFAGHYRINLHANLHTQTFDFMSPGKWSKSEEKKITFDDFWRRTSPSCQLWIMTQRNAVNDIRRLGDTILVPLGWGSKWRRVVKTVKGSKSNIYLNSVYQKI